MATPEEIPVDDLDQVVERVASIDVGKEFGKVCTRVPHPSGSGRRVTRVWDVRSTTNAITQLAIHLVGERIERIIVESTSDYWRPFYYLLEAHGLTVWLVNANQVKQVPGRPKTDKLDAVWLAKLNERGMVNPSFVPPADIRRLRDYTRLRQDLTADRTRHKQRLEKLLEDALIKLSTVASDILGVSGRDMLEALIAGDRDPQTLADLARGRLRVKHAALVEALTGRFDAHHAILARILLDQIDALSTQIDQLTATVDTAIAAIGDGRPEPAAIAVGNPPDTSHPTIERLSEIPGISAHLAQTIIAEVGFNMSVFRTAGHLVSWTKLAPRTVQSGARKRGGKTGKGNPYLKGALSRAAVSAAKTNTFLGERYRRLVRRRGKLKALVAVARSICVIIWHLLANPSLRFHDLGPDFYTTQVNTNRKIYNLVHQLEALGQTVTLAPAA
jgi:transposase